MNQLFRRLNAFAVNLAGLAEAEGRVALHVGGRVLRVLTWWSLAVSLASLAGLVLTVAFMWLLARLIGWPLALLVAGLWLAAAAAGAAWMGVRSALPPPPAGPPPASAAAVAPGSPAAPPVTPASATPRTAVPPGPTPPRSAVS
ncbi:hypothetical protein [Phycisphaera mikurensis]|uniref:Uncharacterized protein n=1 Tax=Phycisphaera mikurensis (strain NBRC 102666 / KCTC 22515 / FYK2301M01) TaxID=1142394 RepID=I0IDF2_PHYMF|nr:hypothetical protein [Phycisphaera mikurensis]MBB6443324.1 hypothetical protein [Phycisphaera mikurensis]BAM03290.1 hypothetical protein PSMK_11310 [Phycisphaera mikurensis NBRC 102666]